MKRTLLAVFVALVALVLCAGPILAADTGVTTSVTVSPVSVEGYQQVGTVVKVTGYVDITATAWSDAWWAYAESNGEYQITAPDGSVVNTDSLFLDGFNAAPGTPVADASQVYVWEYSFTPQQSGYYTINYGGYGYGYWSDGVAEGSSSAGDAREFKVWIDVSPIVVTCEGYGCYFIDVLGTRYACEWQEAVGDGGQYNCFIGAAEGKTLGEAVSITGFNHGKEYRLDIPAGTAVTCNGQKVVNFSVSYTDDGLYFSPNCDFSAPVTLTVIDGDTVEETTFSQVRNGKTL